MRSIVLATHNRHKVEEFQRILGPLGFQVVVPSHLGYQIEVAETGESFAENAMIKARAVANETGRLAVADDSGLVVDALGGEPGVRSARYGPPGTTDAGRINLVLERLQDVPDARRSARFVAAVAVASPGRVLSVVEGTVEGRIAPAPVGEAGFGYDPIFYYPPLGLTFAQMHPAAKDAISHRGRALAGLARFLSTMTPEDGILGQHSGGGIE